MGQRIKDLRGGALDSKPIWYDWHEHLSSTWDDGDPEYSVYEIVTCGFCDRATDENGYCQTRSCARYGSMSESFEGPMMNYYYPLPNSPRAGVHEAARAIKNLPLCLVHFEEQGEDDGWALALTGGGMDLSWEICEAFMRLGYLPPVHFCDLPGMSGRGKTAADRRIVAACKAALRVRRNQLARDLKYLTERAAGWRRGDYR